MDDSRTQHFDETARAKLLEAARRSIETYLATQRHLQLDSDDAVLLEPAGAFVTLRKRGELRGCIGTMDSDDPILDTVGRMAIASATSDPRFPRVEPAELPELTVELSVLTPRRRVSPEEVVVGQHGVYITLGERRGVLLPQVAVEQGWTRDAFLDAVCRKAGLAPGSWRDPDAIVEVFSAEVFGEEAR